jgi:L-lactate dehydrogenase (cytochrome)
MPAGCVIRVRQQNGKSMSELTAPELVPDIAGPQERITALQRPTAAAPYRFRDLLALDDFQRHARRRLPPMIYHYVAGGVETGAAMRGAAQAYTDYAFIPRVFRDVSGRDQGTTLFGKHYDAPFGIPPLGGAAFIAYRGDLVLAEAARRANLPMILSASSLIKLEEVHAQNQDAWYQAYLPGDQTRIDRLVDRVAAAGFPVFIVTADTPMLGNREHNIRTGFSMPISVTPRVMLQSALHPRWLLGVVAQTFLKHGAPHFENTDAERGPPMMSRNFLRNTLDRDKLCWRNIDAIRKRWKGKLLIKGILSPEDARLARESGADGVILSNHGGRQLDHTIAPLDSLPEVVADKGAMSIMIDGGIRRGTDVLKALALGADFVFVGRPVMFAAAIGGIAGVEHAIRLLREEIDRDMALLGIRSLHELSASLLRRRSGHGG